MTTRFRCRVCLGEMLRNKAIVAVALAAGVVGYSGRVWTQTADKLPVAGYPAAKDVANAHELPDPNTDYKVVFSVAQVAKPGEIHPMWISGQ
jgi:hypothetical protein